ncbi:uncharacterized protein [Acropora muricata]|uniref:uncharacterized protein n=1 Tax=Acropora muricata TaxID=159855 RepID=UPI0034E4B3BE
MCWSLISLTIFQGLLVAVGAQRCQTTSLTKCVTDSISLPGNDPSSSMKRATWKAKYQDGDWIVAGHCVHLKGCTKHITVLPDGTRVRIGSNGSLIVERTSNQRNVTGKLQFLFDDLKRRHIFKVNFTVHCICTRAGANLNVSQAVEELFSKEDFGEVYLFDANGTQFAIIHSDKTVWLRNESHSPNTAYRKKVTIMKGSLMFHAINQEDNGTTIILQALLNSSSEQTITRLGALSRKTMRIFLCNSPERSGTSQGSTLYPEHFDYTSSSSTSGLNERTKSISSSSTPGLTSKAEKITVDTAWYKELWGIIFIILVALLLIAGTPIFIVFLINTINNRNTDPPSDIPQGVLALSLGQQGSSARTTEMATATSEKK